MEGDWDDSGFKDERVPLQITLPIKLAGHFTYNLRQRLLAMARVWANHSTFAS